MVVDEEMTEANRARPQEIHDPKTTATRDVELNKEFEPWNQSTSPAPVRPEIPPSEGSPALEHTPTAMVVPRSKRRGLLGLMTIVPEVEHPQSYKNGTKWLITFIVAVAGAAAPLGSAIFFRESLFLPYHSIVDILCCCKF